jgi:hypothetical protein
MVPIEAEEEESFICPICRRSVNPEDLENDEE